MEDDSSWQSIFLNHEIFSIKKWLLDGLTEYNIIKIGSSVSFVQFFLLVTFPKEEIGVQYQLWLGFKDTFAIFLHPSHNENLVHLSIRRRIIR